MYDWRTWNRSFTWAIRREPSTESSVSRRGQPPPDRELRQPSRRATERQRAPSAVAESHRETELNLQTNKTRDQNKKKSNLSMHDWKTQQYIYLPILVDPRRERENHLLGRATKTEDSVRRCGDREFHRYVDDPRRE